MLFGTLWCLLLSSFALLHSAHSFSLQGTRGRTSRPQLTHAATEARDSAAASDILEHRDASPPAWLNCGLLFSSFTDGLEKNQKAKNFLRRGVVRSLLLEARSRYEQQIETSVLSSPCNGPDVESLGNLERVDSALASLLKENTQDSSGNTTPDHLSSAQQELLPLRLVYIPTALYALRRESNNTPGKQRQRARADGKKRRNQIVNFLRRECGVESVDAVTLDLDDASVKHIESSSSSSSSVAPTTDGQELLDEWQPHVIYVEGGNTFWLHHCVEKGGWRELLREYTSRPGTIYCGKSTGAIIAGTVADTAYWKGWDDPLVVPGWTDKKDANNPRLVGLNMLGGERSIFPHMDDSWNDVVSQRRSKMDHAVELLAEDSVLCVDGTSKSVDFL